MDQSLLAIDLGNGRLKAGLFAGGALQGRALVLDYEELPTGWAPWVAGLPPFGGAAASSVLGGGALEGTLATVRAPLPVPLACNPDPGLELDVSSPETVGLDRLYAARAALARGLDEAVVVDVGTALTVDAVRAGGAASGVFLGGAIAPGPRLVARSLAGAAQLFEVRPGPDAPALGKDTRAALEAGVVHTVAGAAVRLAERVRREAGLGSVRLVLTGGARAFAAAPLAEAGWEVLEAEHLVLEGVVASVAGSSG